MSECIFKLLVWSKRNRDSSRTGMLFVSVVVSRKTTHPLGLNFTHCTPVFHVKALQVSGLKRVIKIWGKHIWINVIGRVNFVHVCFQCAPVYLLTGDFPSFWLGSSNLLSSGVECFIFIGCLGVLNFHWLLNCPFWPVRLQVFVIGQVKSDGMDLK